MNIDYSVIIPVYNSEKIITHTVTRVRDFFMSNDFSFELILVNDGSHDLSWEIIRKIALEFPEVISINLLKNYGQHHANLCGFRMAKGKYIITMDDDLQNPPEEISKLIAGLKEGCDVVIGKFASKKHSLIRRLGSRFVGKLIRKVFHVEGNLSLTNFRLIHRDVVDRVCRDKSYAPYIPGLVLKYSDKKCNVTVEHLPRFEGKSNYSLRKVLQLTANILFNHSSIPLRYSAVFGFVISMSSLALSLYFLINAILNGSSSPGWASLAVLLSFFNGILILILSIIGEYIVRIVREIGTPSSYEIRDVVGQ